MNLLKESEMVRLVAELYQLDGTPSDYVHEVIGNLCAKFAVLLSRGWVRSGVRVSLADVVDLLLRSVDLHRRS